MSYEWIYEILKDIEDRDFKNCKINRVYKLA